MLDFIDENQTQQELYSEEGGTGVDPVRRDAGTDLGREEEITEEMIQAGLTVLNDFEWGKI